MNESPEPIRSRRRFLQAVGALYIRSATASSTTAPGPQHKNARVLYGQDTLSPGIRSRLVDNNNGVPAMHILEAGFEQPGRPCVVLVHGFPELAYTWRNQLLPLARAGFHVIAPDVRGYGRSVARPVSYGDSTLPYSILNCVGDVLGLVRALGYEKVAAVVGHDWGGPTAAWCALTRPDIFQSVVFMSTPFDGAPDDLALNSAERPPGKKPDRDIDQALAALPRPRKHYAHYLASREANDDMWHAPQGVHDLLRAQFYFKSADWKGNKPHPLKAWAVSCVLPESHPTGNQR